MSSRLTVARRSLRTRLAGVAVAGLAVIGAGLATAPSASAASVWDSVAQCESGGNWSIATGNGYYGGLQFSAGTWRAYGGGAYAATANKASRAQQIAIAQKVLAGQGPGAWPACGRKAGLTRANGGAAVAAPAPAAKAPAAKAPAAKAPAGAAGTYTVKRGDTLSHIASRYHVAGGYRALAAHNGISNPNAISVGQVLRLS